MAKSPSKSDEAMSASESPDELHAMAWELFVKFAQLPEAAQKTANHYAEQSFVLAREFIKVAGEQSTGN